MSTVLFVIWMRFQAAENATLVISAVNVQRDTSMLSGGEESGVVVESLYY
jgi:hypothetical protein